MKGPSRQMTPMPSVQPRSPSAPRPAAQPHSRRRFIRMAAASGVAATFLAGVRRTARAGTSLRIGALYNQTGDASSIDIAGLRGMQVAASEVNARGGVLGLPLELIAIDGRSDPASVAAAARQMIEAGVIAIGGLNDSDSAEAAGVEAQRAGVPFVTAGATLPSLPEQIGNTFFMACYGDDTQAAAVAGYARDRLNAATAWVLYDHDALYTSALRQYFVDAFTRAGGRALAKVSYGSGERDFSAQVGQLRSVSLAPDILFVSALPAEAGPIVVQLRRAGFMQPVLSGDGFDTPELIEVAGPLAAGVSYSTHVAYDNPAPLVQQFVAAYTNAYGEAPDTAFAALGYDALHLIADAATRAGFVTPAALRTALAGTRDFAGVTGVISYAPGVRSPIKPVTIAGVRDGRAAFVELIQPR